MKVLLTILFFIHLNTSFANDMRYYDIEIVIIENLTTDARNKENWPLEVNLNQAEKTVQLGEPVNSEWLPQDVDLKSSYTVLKSSEYQLSDYIEKISESKKQRVIFHTAWRQPGLDKNQALPVYFKREISAPPVINDEVINMQNNEESPSYSESDQEPVSTPSILEGILRVTLARYLHLEAELTLRNKLPEITKSDNPFTILDNEKERMDLKKSGVIHLKQKRRRIRSTELHYLDHPVLSMLVRMTPYEKPEDDVVTSLNHKKK